MMREGNEQGGEDEEREVRPSGRERKREIETGGEEAEGKRREEREEQGERDAKDGT